MNFKNVLVIILVIALIGGAAFVAANGLSIGNMTIGSIGDSMKLGLDINGGVVVVYEAETDFEGEALQGLMIQTKEVISRRINELGLTEPNVTVQGTNRLRIELPGVKDAQEAIDSIGKTAQLEFILVTDNTRVIQGMQKEDFQGELVLTGTNVKSAGTRLNQYNQPVVSMEMDGEGATLFADGTTKAAQSGKAIAIVLDGVVISAPTVSKTIPDGKSIIEGGFTTEEAKLLAMLIQGGALPVNLTEVQTSVVGPTLGLDALNASVQAAFVGLLLVVIFMIGYYRVPGIVASIALSIYTLLLLFSMVLLNATLTLPGVAGIVLSLGMAVDANVIIFERIKEELRIGKTVRSAIEFGFKRALRTIVDANITTLIAGVVLFFFGEGPIKGFSVTLMLGIVISLFTALVVTKSLLKQSLGFGISKNTKFYGL